MFFIYNKDRIISVVIAFSTVVILFLMAGVLENKSLNKTIQTSKKVEKLSISDKLFSAIRNAHEWKNFCHTIVTK